MVSEESELHVVGESVGEREALLEALVGVADDSLFALDAERRFLAVTDGVAEVTGRDVVELLGAPVSTVVDEGDVGTLQRMLRKVGADGGSVDGEFELRTAEGALKTCELRLGTVAADAPDGEGDTQWTVGRIEDVTGNRRRQEQVAVLDRVLRHNVRNKMGSIVGYLRSAVGGSAGDDTAVALEEATSLLALSEKARECHRLLEREPTRTRVEDLRDLLGPVVKRRREDFPEARISLETPAHPPVVADRELFVAAVMELVDNAVEHNDHERPTVGLRVEPAGEWVAVRVTDDGPGIPEAERRAILSGEEQPLYHASGLGVWFVKWAVRLVGGELDIADNEPRGTVVTLRLPTHPTVESTTATGDAGADAD